MTRLMAERFGRKLHSVLRFHTISSSTAENKAPPCTTLQLQAAKLPPSSVALSEPFSCLFKKCCFCSFLENKLPEAVVLVPVARISLEHQNYWGLSFFNAHPWSEQTLAVFQGAAKLQLLVPEHLFSPSLVLSA